MQRKGFFESKRGISVMVSYILLVVIVIIISGLVYVWLKTYIPKQALECPDGTSLFIKEASFDSNTSQLIVTLKNNGRFNLAGYFIHAANSSEQELPTIDLSDYLDETQSGNIFGNSVLFFEEGTNLFSPGLEEDYFFDIPVEIGVPYSIRIVPTRFQEVEGKSRFTSCSNARVEQIIGEPYVCTPNTCSGLGYICGIWGDGCGGLLDCGTCTSPEVCNSSGQCMAPEQCTDTCDTYGYECGNWVICGNVTDCGNCTSPEVCDSSGQCVSSCGDGICQEWEDCSCLDCEGEQADCQVGEICQNGICVFNAEGEFNSCGDYCGLFGYSLTYSCQDNPNKCEPPQGPEGGIYIGYVEGANETYGNSFCLADPYCCCVL